MFIWQQECIPVGCVPPAAVAVRGEGGLHQAAPPGPGTPAIRHTHPQDQAPPRTRDTPPWDKAPPGTRHPLRPGTPSDQAPPQTRHPWDPQAPSVGRMTDRCKHITLPKTSFAGGNKSFSLSLHNIYKNANIANFVLDLPLEMNKANEVCIFEFKPLIPTGI